MKHSTFYTDKKLKRHVYTTISLTVHHRYLREAYNGVTYEHDDHAKLFFVAGAFPLDKPIGKHCKVVN